MKMLSPYVAKLTHTLTQAKRHDRKLKVAEQVTAADHATRG